MTPDGFLTFLTLIAAVYTVAAPVTKLRVRLEVRFFQIVAAVLAISLALYLQFFDALKQPCPAALGGACRRLVFPADGSFTAKDAAFLVVLGWMLAALLIHGLSKLGPSSLAALSKLVDELLVEERHAELLKLVKPHLPLIDRVSRRELRLQRLHDWLAWLNGKASHAYMIRKLDDENDHGRGRMPAVIGLLHVLVPSHKNAEKHAEDILRSMYRADELRRFMVKQRPYAAISLLRLEHDERFDFSDRLFGDLMADTGSALYTEVREQQTTRYQLQEFPERSGLLRFLFEDALNARRLNVYKPVGDYILRRLNPAIDAEYVTNLNGPATHFEDEWWRDSTYIGVQFFRIMVEAAARQGIEWHMWLYYLPLILKELVKNYDTSNPLVDDTAEFPTRAARLIYEIIDALGDFVRLAPELPEGSPHRGVPDQFVHANGNIPVSAAIALGQCIKTIALSDRLGDRFSTYMHECVLRDITELPQDGELRRFLIQSLVRGGETFGRGNHQEYGQRLANFLDNRPDHPHTMLSDVADYIAALDTAYPRALPERLRQ